MDPIARHYGVSGLLQPIREALVQAGKDPARLMPADLAPVDEFHIRGRQATLELADLAEPRAGMAVLDAGSGLGGSTRFLASERGCTVTGLDLTPEYCDTAAALSAMVGLDGRTAFCCGSATAMPFRDGAFDLAWTQHAQMNIADKAALFAEMRRVLRPGGRFAFHDVLAGAAGPPYFPVPWAGEAGISFLIAPEDLRELLEGSSFRVLEWREKTQAACEWFLAMVQQRKQGAPPPLGLHLLMGSSAAAKFGNLGRNLSEGRVRVFQGLLEAV